MYLMFNKFLRLVKLSFIFTCFLMIQSGWSATMSCDETLTVSKPLADFLKSSLPGEAGHSSEPFKPLSRIELFSGVDIRDIPSFWSVVGLAKVAPVLEPSTDTIRSLSPVRGTVILAGNRRFEGLLTQVHDDQGGTYLKVLMDIGGASRGPSRRRWYSMLIPIRNVEGISFSEAQISRTNSTLRVGGLGASITDLILGDSDLRSALNSRALQVTPLRDRKISGSNSISSIELGEILESRNSRRSHQEGDLTEPSQRVGPTGHVSYDHVGSWITVLLRGVRGHAYVVVGKLVAYEQNRLTLLHLARDVNSSGDVTLGQFLVEIAVQRDSFFIDAHSGVMVNPSLMRMMSFSGSIVLDSFMRGGSTRWINFELDPWTIKPQDVQEWTRLKEEIDRGFMVVDTQAIFDCKSVFSAFYGVDLSVYAPYSASTTKLKFEHRFAFSVPEDYAVNPLGHDFNLIAHINALQALGGYIPEFFMPEKHMQEATWGADASWRFRYQYKHDEGLENSKNMRSLFQFFRDLFRVYQSVVIGNNDERHGVVQDFRLRRSNGEIFLEFKYEPAPGEPSPEELMNRVNPEMVQRFSRI